jgi:GntR family transcriptional regulator
MYIPLDLKSGTPLYIQMKDQMRVAVASGALQPGDQLPPVRDLATRLRVNPNTVARVYRELQAEGLLSSRQGSGTFVSQEAVALSRQEGERIVRQRLREAAAMGLVMGLDGSALRRLFGEALKQATGDGSDTPTPIPSPEGEARKAVAHADHE